MPFSKGLLTALFVIAGYSIWGNYAYADTVEVTFTGTISINIDPTDYAFTAGDSFSAVLTYDSSQPNLGAVPGTGLYGNYSFTATVQTAGGPVTYGGPISWSPNCGCEYDPLTVYNDVAMTVNPIGNVVVDEVEEGATVGFVLADYSDTAFTSDSLSDVNWQTSFALAEGSSASLPLTDQPKIAFRAPNAADVAEGSIDALSVQDIPAPEPSSLVLLASGLVMMVAVKFR